MLLTAALGVLGVASGALAARVAEWQVVLIPMSVVSLALAHYFAYRRGVGGYRQRVLLATSRCDRRGISAARLHTEVEAVKGSTKGVGLTFKSESGHGGARCAGSD